jgi:hypothetical protein
VLAKVEFQDASGVLHVTLYHEHDPVSVNGQLMRDGWVRIPAKAADARLAKLVEELTELEAQAKKAHVRTTNRLGGAVCSVELSSRAHDPLRCVCVVCCVYSAVCGSTVT